MLLCYLFFLFSSCFFSLPQNEGGGERGHNDKLNKTAKPKTNSVQMSMHLVQMQLQSQNCMFVKKQILFYFCYLLYSLQYSISALIKKQRTGCNTPCSKVAGFVLNTIPGLCLLILGSLFGMKLPYLVIVTWRPPFLKGGDWERVRQAGTENEKDRENTRGLNSNETEIWQERPKLLNLPRPNKSWESS